MKKPRVRMDGRARGETGTATRPAFCPFMVMRNRGRRGGERLHLDQQWGAQDRSEWKNERGENGDKN